MGQHSRLVHRLELHCCLLSAFQLRVGLGGIGSVAEDFLLLVLLDRACAEVEEILDVVLAAGGRLVRLFLAPLVLGVLLVLFDDLALLLLGLAQAFLAFPAALGDLVRLVVGLQDEDVVDWRPAVLVRLLAVLDFLHELVDEHVVELLVLDRDVVVLEVLDLLAHQLLPELALVLSLVFLERVVVVSVEDFQPLDLGVGLGAVGRPLRLSDHLLPLLLALVVLVALVLLRLSRADVGRGWLFLAHLALLLLPLTLQSFSLQALVLLFLFAFLIDDLYIGEYLLAVAHFVKLQLQVFVCLGQRVLGVLLFVWLCSWLFSSLPLLVIQQFSLSSLGVLVGLYERIILG